MSPRSGSHGKAQSMFSPEAFDKTNKKGIVPPTGIGRNLSKRAIEQIRAVGDSTILNPTDTPRQRAIDQ